MTREEQLALLEKIRNTICGIFDGIADEFDEDSEMYQSIADAEDDLETLAKSLEEGEYDESVNYYEYLVYDFDEEQEVRVHKTYSPDEADKMLKDVSKTICFSDCSDERVTKIIYRGKAVTYSGWQPGMVYEFVDGQGNVVYTAIHPEWEH